MMDLYYPNSAWLSVRQDVFDRLDQYQERAGTADLGTGVRKAAGVGRGAATP